ncbi:MAG: trans-octaprenyltranstransferase [Deltaproteobacteria bacterium]|nr:trans-octaprenyltranstransferase [Deltaproteobacteria bacterium]
MRRTLEVAVVNGSMKRTDTEAVMEPLSLVSRREGLGSLADRLGEIQSWLAKDLGTLEALLESSANVEGDLAERAAAHLLERPGKRIRPLCVVLASKLGDGLDEDDRAAIENLAAAAELVHAATLLHDDVIDLGTERRGAPTARLLFGNPASVLGGDHLLVEALRRVRSAGHDRLLGKLLDVVGEMVAAEAIQLERRGRFEADREAYLNVVRGKTAVLFEWSMIAGGTVAGLDGDALARLGRAGIQTGIAFQMVDDTLDLAESAGDTGKDTLLDLREGKLTWPLIIASERDPSLVEDFQAIADDPGRLDEGDFVGELRQRIVATGCVSATLERAISWAQDARSEISFLPEGPARRALETVIDISVRRTL